MLRAAESSARMEGPYRFLVLHPRHIACISDDEITAVAGASGFRRRPILVFSDAGVHGERGLVATSTESCDRPGDSDSTPACDGLWNSSGLGTSAPCGFSFFRLRADIFGIASRFNSVHSNQSCRLDHAVDEALRVLLACCDVA